MNEIRFHPITLTGNRGQSHPSFRDNATAMVLLSALVRPLDVAGIAIIVGGVAVPHVLRIVKGRQAAASALSR